MIARRMEAVVLDWGKCSAEKGGELEGRQPIQLADENQADSREHVQG